MKKEILEIGDIVGCMSMTDDSGDEQEIIWLCDWSEWPLFIDKIDDYMIPVKVKCIKADTPTGYDPLYEVGEISEDMPLYDYHFIRKGG